MTYVIIIVLLTIGWGGERLWSFHSPEALLWHCLQPYPPERQGMPRPLATIMPRPLCRFVSHRRWRGSPTVVLLSRSPPSRLWLWYRV